jgi:NTP pyrophosphatase (non-canonical NTP hydrolase)
MTSNDTPADGHELARFLITRHGVDRYPGITDQALKAAAELGELADAILKHQTGHDGCPRDLYFGTTSECPHIRKEYGDAGLALFALGNKLGINLGAAMEQVVTEETRTFATADTTEAADA